MSRCSKVEPVVRKVLEENLETRETVKIPVLDDIDEMKVIDTFNEEQLWYVCALAHAYEKLENKSKKQQERIEYLERSNNRREDTIIGYRLEDIGIVAELEEWLKEETKLSDDYFVGGCHTDYIDVLEKIQKLKKKYK